MLSNLLVLLAARCCRRRTYNDRDSTRELFDRQLGSYLLQQHPAVAGRTGIYRVSSRSLAIYFQRSCDAEV